MKYVYFLKFKRRDTPLESSKKGKKIKGFKMELVLVIVVLSVFYLIIWNWFLNSEDEELKWFVFWWWLFDNDDE